MDERRQAMIDKILDQLFSESDDSLCEQLKPEHWGMYEEGLTGEDNEGDIPQSDKPPRTPSAEETVNPIEAYKSTETPLNKKKDEEDD